MTYKVLCEYLVRSMSCFKPPRCVNPRISTCRIRTFSTLPFTFFQCVVFLFRAEGNTTLYMSQTKRKFFNAECYHNSNVQSSNTAQNPLPSNTLGITVEEPEQIPGHYEGKVASGPRTSSTYKKEERKIFTCYFQKLIGYTLVRYTIFYILYRHIYIWTP